MAKIGNEIILDSNDLIVSSTDIKGNILYTNEIFSKISGYTKEELIGQAHNIIRHEDMPKTIFYLLWDKVLKGERIYAFVKNKSKNGDYYWVKAYVKPVYKNDEISQIISYRKPLNDFAKNFISKLYSQLCAYEKTHTVDESFEYFLKYLDERNLSYEQFVDRLSLGKSVENKVALQIDTAKLKNAHLIFKQHIITEIEEGNHYTEVVGSCCCEFGKWIKSLSNESFTQMDSWKDTVLIHDRIHEEMMDYVEQFQNGASQEELDQISQVVENDVVNLFEKINYTIDNSKE